METLSKEEIAYGQQKNREHMWNQAKNERIEYRKLVAELQDREVGKWMELDHEYVYVRYKDLCEKANITPW